MGVCPSPTATQTANVRGQVEADSLPTATLGTVAAVEYEIWAAWTNYSSQGTSTSTVASLPVSTTPNMNSSSSNAHLTLQPWVIVVIAVVGALCILIPLIIFGCWRRRQGRKARLAKPPRSNGAAQRWYQRKDTWGSDSKALRGIGESGDEPTPTSTPGSARAPFLIPHQSSSPFLIPYQSSSSLESPNRPIGTLPSSKELRERRRDLPSRRSFDAVSMSEFSGPISTVPSTSVWPERSEIMEVEDPPLMRSPRHESMPGTRSFSTSTSRSPTHISQGTRHHSTPSHANGNRTAPRIWTNEAQGWWEDKEDKEETPEEPDSAYVTPSPTESELSVTHRELQALQTLSGVSERLARNPGRPTGHSTDASSTRR